MNILVVQVLNDDADETREIQSAWGEEMAAAAPREVPGVQNVVKLETNIAEIGPLDGISVGVQMDVAGDARVPPHPLVVIKLRMMTILQD